jgi:hypothetical protein
MRKGQHDSLIIVYGCLLVSLLISIYVIVRAVLI